MKDHVQEPRPFVVWLEKAHHVPVDEFYNLKRKDRGALVKEQLAEQEDIPKFLRKHWQETGFAFPSGHTMFAASWALLGVGLLWPRRRTMTIAILLVWATGVMGSRLLLGMHWPRDLVVATLISRMLVTLATGLQKGSAARSRHHLKRRDRRKGAKRRLTVDIVHFAHKSMTCALLFRFAPVAKMVVYKADCGELNTLYSLEPHNGK